MGVTRSVSDAGTSLAKITATSRRQEDTEISLMTCLVAIALVVTALAVIALVIILCLTAFTAFPTRLA